MAREPIHAPYEEDKWLILISSSSGLANARNCEGVRLEEHGGNAWEGKEDMLASRPVDVAVGEGNADSVARHMLDDCFDGCGVSAVDEDESEDSTQTIEGGETGGHPDINTEPLQGNQQPVKNPKRNYVLWLVEVSTREEYSHQADMQDQEELERMSPHWA